MHTVMVTAAGFALLAVFCAIGWSRARERGLAKAARLFIPVWLIATLANVTIGVVSAGYTVMQELPVFVVTFALPAAAVCASQDICTLFVLPVRDARGHVANPPERNADVRSGLGSRT